MRAYSETKVSEIHRRVFILTVPYKIVLPGIGFARFATALNSANIVDPVVIMEGLGMAL